MSPTARDAAWVGEEFDRRAETYDDSTMHHWQAEQAAGVLQPRPDQRILDIAAGTGLAARACIAITDMPGQIVGVDLSLRMLQVAAQTSTSSYIRADAAVLPFRPSVFDAVICVAAIPYLRDLAAAVHEWRRVARPHAVLVFTTPAADGIPALRLIREAAAQHELELPDPHADLGTIDRIAQTVEDLRLRVDRIERHSYPDQLETDPKTAYEYVLNYGFADQLRTAPHTQQAHVFTTYQQAYSKARADGTGEQAVMITRCWFPTD